MVMVRFIVGLILSALCFMFVLPHIDGITFSGGFGAAIGVSVLFAVLAVLVGFVITAGVAALGVVTGGRSLLLTIPAFLLGFWLFPAVVLQVLAAVATKSFGVSGWGPAILGGLVLLIPALIIGARVSVRASASFTLNGGSSRLMTRSGRRFR